MVNTTATIMSSVVPSLLWYHKSEASTLKDKATPSVAGVVTVMPPEASRRQHKSLFEYPCARGAPQATRASTARETRRGQCH